MANTVTILILLYVACCIKTIHYRASSIECAVESLRQVLKFPPDESMCYMDMIKPWLIIQYYELSQRDKASGIVGYVKRIYSIPNPSPEHVAMLLLSNLAIGFRFGTITGDTNISDKFKTNEDFANWCDAGKTYLFKNKY